MLRHACRSRFAASASFMVALMVVTMATILLLMISMSERNGWFGSMLDSMRVKKREYLQMRYVEGGERDNLHGLDEVAEQVETVGTWIVRQEGEEVLQSGTLRVERLQKIDCLVVGGAVLRVEVELIGGLLELTRKQLRQTHVSDVFLDGHVVFGVDLDQRREREGPGESSRSCRTRFRSPAPPEGGVAP